MKFTKIFKTTAVALGAVLVLSGCIRETFPKESTITESQLMSGQMEVVAENLLKGIPSSMMYVSLGSEGMHGDFGYHGMGINNDQAAQTVVTNGWSLGYAPAYNRFYPAAWGRGYAENGYMSSYAWYTYYPIIKSCNDVIKLVEGNEDLAAYSAIARTYRALFYLDLARLYECLYAEVQNGTDYEGQQLLVKGLTVPIVSENTKEEDATNNPRATREEMFTFILDDLAFAEEVFKGDYTPTAVTDPTLAVVYGLYARAYLWLGGFEDGLNGALPSGNEAYAKALEYAQKAIATFGGAIMTEAEWTDVTTAFNTKASSWMWTLYHSTDTIAGNLHQFIAHMAPEASYGYCPLTNPGVGSKAYERLGDGDFRKKLIISPTHFTWGVIENDQGEQQEGWILDESKAAANYAAFKPYTQIPFEEYVTFAPYTFFKFRPAQGNRNDYKTAGAVALPLMRCEEMYFIDMECEYHLNGADAAFTKLVNWMTTYRDPGFQTGTAQGEGIRDLIIFHKGIEFWGEGLIMFDMKRLDMGIDTNYEGTNYDPNRRFVSEGRVPWWTYCIPQGEIQLNTALKAKNNPDPSLTLTNGGPNA